MSKTLYIMRHGETLFNTQKRVQGWCDSPLTAKGIEQAKAVKDYFEKKGILFQAAYASTQERASDTLSLITDTPYKQLKGIKEMNFGSFEAREEELLPKFRPGANSFEDLLVPYGGESIDAVGQRVKATILTVLEKSKADTTLMVSHGAAMWGLILQLSVSFPKGLGLSNCAICKLTYEGGQLRLVALIEPSKDFLVHTF